MEHDDFSGSQFSSIWESLSSEECGSGTSFLPELCSPESSSWIPSNILQKSAFDYGVIVTPQDQDFLAFDSKFLVPSNKQESQKNVDFSNPDSPCSPLFFNFLPQDHFLQPYGPLHLQIQEAPLNVLNSKPSLPRAENTATICPAGNANSTIQEGSEIKAPAAPKAVKEEYNPDGNDYPPSKRKCLETRNSPVESRGAQSKSTLPQPECISTSTITSAVALGPALNTDGKPRAKRGSATDPQSVYARQRRERINERLRALQGLVPNGAKVDIVTMLEEAINYVKFLQLQVKLLSSDEYWMYAPTTYNGMNISLGMHIGMQSYLKIKDS